MTNRATQSEKIDEISVALCKQQEAMRAIRGSKKADIPTKSGARMQYAYATHADVLRAIHEPFATNGLSAMQRFETTDDGQMIVVTQIIHTSGQWIASYFPLHVNTNDLRVLGSAITYAKRYSLCAMAGLAIVGDDDDGGAAAAKHSQSLAGIDEDEPLADYPAECAYLKAVAVELYGATGADGILESLASKRFRISDGDWRLIPRVRLDYAIEALKKNAKSPDRAG
mgnify:CR=1 FL=1